MKTELTLLAIGSSLLLAAPALRAQNTNANSLPLNQTLKYQSALEYDHSLGERALLPPGLKEKLQLAEAQRVELKPFEDDFAKTSEEYQTAAAPHLGKTSRSAVADPAKHAQVFRLCGLLSL